MDVKNAVNEYNISNISCTTLATKYGIPAATLRRYIKRKIEVSNFKFVNICPTLLSCAYKMYL